MFVRTRYPTSPRPRPNAGLNDQFGAFGYDRHERFFWSDDAIDRMDAQLIHEPRYWGCQVHPRQPVRGRDDALLQFGNSSVDFPILALGVGADLLISLDDFYFGFAYLAFNTGDIRSDFSF